MDPDKVGGILPVVGDTFYPMSRQEVQDLEQTLGRSLPDEYREFLLRHGAISFEESVLALTAENPPPWISDNEAVPVKVFFGGTAPRATFGLRWYVLNFLDRLPAGLLPIATSALSDLLVMDLGWDTRSTGPSTTGTPSTNRMTRR